MSREAFTYQALIALADLVNTLSSKTIKEDLTKMKDKLKELSDKEADIVYLQTEKENQLKALEVSLAEKEKGLVLTREQLNSWKNELALLEEDLFARDTALENKEVSMSQQQKELETSLEDARKLKERTRINQEAVAKQLVAVELKKRELDSKLAKLKEAVG